MPDIAGFHRRGGFVPVLWSAREGRLLLELPADAPRMLHLTRISHGLGEFPLERGQLSRPTLVRFERRGARLAMIAENLAWRASEPDTAEAVRQSFPESALALFDIVDTDATRTVVDATAFLLSDMAGIGGHLTRLGHVGYAHDPKRSFILEERSGAFETSTQIETRLTFTKPDAPPHSVWNSYGAREGMAALAPDPRAVTVGVRHAFIRLPDAGFEPRHADPRAGYCCSVIHDDFSVPPGDDPTQRLMIRHRLQRVDPSAVSGPVVAPITYYVDRGFPEPIRSAVLEGARWWADAFAAAGFEDAFRVELLPEGADPMDLRYNTITFAGRATRAFAWGGTVVDPRTGEIIKGEVTLTALRDRHFMMMAEALAAGLPPDERRAAAEAAMLGFVRLLAAHELGHTLGLDHNHAAVKHTSVMDYAAPLVECGDDGCIDLAAPYRSGIGSWDKVAIAYGYRQFPPGTEPADQRRSLDRIIADATADGHLFLGNDDSAPLSSAHPVANYWTRGSDPAAELDRMLGVRRAALAKLDPGVLADGEPVARLEDYLTPLYRLHLRYVAAASKSIGGLHYSHAVAGDGLPPPTPVDGSHTRAALAAILRTLAPAELMVPEALLGQLGPRPLEYPRPFDALPNRTGPTFDPLAAAASAVSTTLAALLEPHRLNRVVEYALRDCSQLSLDELLAALIDATWDAGPASGLALGIALTVDQGTLDALVATLVSPVSGSIVRGTIWAALLDLRRTAAAELADGTAGARRASRLMAVATIDALERQPPWLPFQPPGPSRPFPGP